jgi:hypothetical protein
MTGRRIVGVQTPRDTPGSADGLSHILGVHTPRDTPGSTDGSSSH